MKMKSITLLAICFSMFFGSSLAYSETMYASPDGFGTACSQAQPCNLLMACNSLRSDVLLIITEGDYELFNSTCTIAVPNVGIQGASVDGTSITCDSSCFSLMTAPVEFSSMKLIDGSGYRSSALIDSPYMLWAGEVDVRVSHITAYLNNTSAFLSLMALNVTDDTVLNTYVDSISILGDVNSDGIAIFVNGEASLSVTNSSVTGTGGAFVRLTAGKLNQFEMSNIFGSNVGMSDGTFVQVSQSNFEATGQCYISDFVVDTAIAYTNSQMFNLWGCDSTTLLDITLYDMQGLNWAFSIAGSELDANDIAFYSWTDTSGGGFFWSDSISAQLTNVTLQDGSFGTLLNAFTTADDDADTTVTLNGFTGAQITDFGIASLFDAAFTFKNFQVTNSSLATGASALISLNNPTGESTISDGSFSGDIPHFVNVAVSNSVTASVNVTNVSFDADAGQIAFTVSPSTSGDNNVALNIDQCTFTGEMDRIVQCSNVDVDGTKFEINVSECDCDLDNVVLIKGTTYDSNGSCDMNVDGSSTCSQAGRKWILATVIILVAALIIAVVATAVILDFARRRKRSTYETIDADVDEAFD